MFDYETAKMLNEVAGQLGKKARCHIKVDTGMRRIGLEPDKSGIETVKKVKKLKNIDAVGIFTHFATADEIDKTKSIRQLEKFDNFIKELEKENITFEYKHCANSAAVIDMPQTNKDLVRLGIAMYGMYPSEDVIKRKVCLRPALALKKSCNHGEMCW